MNPLFRAIQRLSRKSRYSTVKIQRLLSVCAMQFDNVVQIACPVLFQVIVMYVPPALLTCLWTPGSGSDEPAVFTLCNFIRRASYPHLALSGKGVFMCACTQLPNIPSPSSGSISPSATSPGPSSYHRGTCPFSSGNCTDPHELTRIPRRGTSF